MDQPYAIIGPDNKAINFVVWDGVTEFDYGQSQGSYIVPLNGIGSYGFGWLWDGEKFVDPNPPSEQP